MPGKWITRAGEDDEIGRTSSGDEMAAHLRESRGRSPDTDQWFRLDRLTVGFASKGGPVRAVYRWEFDVFEGLPRQARLPELGDVNAAKQLGMSVVDFLSEPRSVRSRAANETTADQGAAIRAADALLHVLRQMTDARDDGMSGDMRAFLGIDNTQRLDRRGLLEPSAYLRTKTALLSIVTRLAHGDRERALQVYTDVCEHGRTIAHVLQAWQQRWLEEDYERHLRSA